jgi:hypothetical protein
MAVNRHIDPAAAQQLQHDLRELSAAYLENRIHLVQDAFPDIWADAEHFVSETHYLPWEFGVAYLDGPLGAMQEKYGALSSRHRPASEQVSARTDIFYEAAALAFEHLFKQPPGF